VHQLPTSTRTLGSSIITSGLLILGLLLSQRLLQDYRALHKSAIEPMVVLFHGFAAINANGDLESILPNHNCRAALFFVVRGSDPSVDIEMWNQVIARNPFGLGACSYGVCVSPSCHPPKSTATSFHLLHSVAYEPASIFARLSKTHTYIIEDGKWMRQWTFSAPMTPDAVARDLKNTGL